MIAVGLTGVDIVVLWGYSVDREVVSEGMVDTAYKPALSNKVTISVYNM